MKTIKIEPMKEPYEKEIEDSLESLQREVGGNIEAVYPFDDDVAIICNEEGKINGMDLNRALRDDDGNIVDVIAGPFIIAGLTEDSFGSLTDEQLKRYMDIYRSPEIFIGDAGKILGIPVKDAGPGIDFISREKSGSAFIYGELSNFSEYKKGNIRSVWVSFPLSRDRFDSAMKEIEVDTENGGKFFVSDYDCFVNGVRTRLGPHTSLNDINALAVSLETMNPSDVKKFEAIAESDRQADLPELVNYSYNLHCWEFSPDVRNDYDLGLATVESSDLFDTENLGAFAGYISYEKIGAVTRKENGGIFTGEGYICRNGNRIQEIYNAKDGFVSEKEMKKQKNMGGNER